MFGMNRREFITVLGGAAVAWPLGARAQLPAGKVWRIGILETISQPLNAANLAALRRGLRELGYIEGQNLLIEYRSAEGRAERFPDLASELVRLKVDVIVTRGTPAVLAAKNATSEIPVVMAAIGEPLVTGAVTSLARPGGNVTGLSSFTYELTPKRVELLKEMLPGTTRIAGLFNLSNPVVVPEWEAAKAAALSLGIAPHVLDVRNSQDISRALDAEIRQRADALLVSLDGLIQENQATILDLVAMRQLPAMYPSREFVDGGGLLAYGVSYPPLYFRAASFVDKIFKGAKPADLPVEQPTKMELIINLKTAKALGLTMPPTLLARADEVIE
jgi:putative tryptophan/tyrosine transport system substrate-binding protein